MFFGKKKDKQEVLKQKEAQEILQKVIEHPDLKADKDFRELVLQTTTDPKNTPMFLKLSKLLSYRLMK